MNIYYSVLYKESHYFVVMLMGAKNQVLYHGIMISELYSYYPVLKLETSDWESKY